MFSYTEIYCTSFTRYLSNPFLIFVIKTRLCLLYGSAAIFGAYGIKPKNQILIFYHFLAMTIISK